MYGFFLFLYTEMILKDSGFDTIDSDSWGHDSLMY